jgi:hypothetical protein
MHGYTAAANAAGSRPSASSTRRVQQAGQQQTGSASIGRRTPVFV